jgi:hypothetical protein
MLYEITLEDKTTYGTKLAVNSQSNWVMEEKGTGQIIVVPRSSVKEVKPYTVDLKFTTGHTVYSYTSSPGKYEVNDVLIMPDVGFGPGFAIVVGVDTTQAKASKELQAKASKELQPIGKVMLDKTNL